MASTSRSKTSQSSSLAQQLTRIDGRRHTITCVTTSTALIANVHIGAHAGRRATADHQRERRRSSGMETTSVSDGAVLYEVMRHAEWRIKAAFPLLCRQCLQQSRQQSHWDFLARCLQADFLLHVPAITGLVTRELFLELWLTRHLFVPTAPRPRLLGTAPDGGEPAEEPDYVFNGTMGDLAPGVTLSHLV